MKRQLPIMITLLALAVPASSLAAGAADQQYQNLHIGKLQRKSKTKHHTRHHHHSKKHTTRKH